jgi:TolB-like protein/DNA-binding winged helix-turn-helix (wHTH) protein
MPLAPGTAVVYRFGEFEMDCVAHELRRSGVRVRLQIQPFQLLKTLLEHAGQLVTREELRQKLWPSSVYVDFDHGLNNAIARLREALGDAPGEPRFIETVPRLGYRFIHAVDVSSALAKTQAAPPPVAGPQPPHRNRLLVVLGSAALAASLVALAWHALRPQEKPAGGDVPSLAVMTFANLSDDPDNQRFAEGLAEEMRAKLAGIRGLRIVGRASTLAMGSGTTQRPEIAKSLGVDHYLEGSIRQSGSRLRVAVTLIDLPGEVRRWSRTYDRQFADVLDIQEDIARAVAAELQVELVDADERHLSERGTRDPEAFRLFLVAGELGSSDRALQLYGEVLARDPDFAAAHASVASVHFFRGWSLLSQPELNESLGRAAAERAMTLAPDLSSAREAHALFEAWLARFRGDSAALERAKDEFLRAHELDPSDSAVLFNHARAMIWEDPARAQVLWQQTAELNPLSAIALAGQLGRPRSRAEYEKVRAELMRLHGQAAYPETSSFNLALGALELQWGQLADAVPYLRRMAEQRPSPEFANALWAIFLSLGDPRAAREALRPDGDDVVSVISQAAALNMEGRLEEAYVLLERRRTDYPRSLILDVTTARQALLTARHDRAAELLESRMPDLLDERRPITARSLIPAVDLALAYRRTGRKSDAGRLLERIRAYFESPNALREPQFLFQRARYHAVASEPEAALAALENAYDQGLRLLWGLDLNPQPLLYVDSVDTDPTLEALRAHPRYQAWRGKIGADNARMLEQLRAKSMEAEQA